MGFGTRPSTHLRCPSIALPNLKRLDFAGVPDSARAELACIFAVNALRNDLLAGELAGVLGLLGDAGVPVVALKGIALAESLYSDLALRTCADIDILGCLPKMPARRST